MKKSSNNKTSIIFIILVNIIPIIGVLFYNWNISNILLLYWLESGIIGFYFILRMFKISIFGSIFLVPFFILHFGFFMLAHYIILGAIVDTNLVLKRDIIETMVIGGLILSHGISFKLNFLNKKEFLNTNLTNEMIKPYKRIVLMHIALIFGGILSVAAGKSIFLLILFILLKIVLDVISHKIEHGFYTN